MRPKLQVASFQYVKYCLYTWKTSDLIVLGHSRQTIYKGLQKSTNVLMLKS
jgi:hypothetical protein